MKMITLIILMTPNTADTLKFKNVVVQRVIVQQSFPNRFFSASDEISWILEAFRFD